jgi:lipid II:glycine glycyltransferase (peptidoglycan interpeptide bridge formation enzyme)
MAIRSITPEEKNSYDALVRHPLQAYEWGEFREKSGVKVIRRGLYDGEKLVSGFQLTIHKIPKTPWTVGYLPKGEEPNAEMLDELFAIGKQENCVFIQLEPNIIKPETEYKIQNTKYQIQNSAHPLFTKYTFVLDLTKTEEELLTAMHSKARYNIKIARKHNVIVEEDNSKEAFEEYLRLTRETTTRQKFYAHTENYHRLMWQALKPKTEDQGPKTNLSAHLFTAKYDGKILTAWIVFVFKDKLYYPYGASSSENREVMSSNLMMWEVIRWGKHHNLKTFDMWGALGPNPNEKDPWYGFHNFKEKYGPKHVEFVGSYDLVINPLLYTGYKLADKLRWILLKVKK